MQTREGNSIDWDAVRRDYETKPISDRALAKNVGVSDTALRKRAKKGGWVKLIDASPNIEPECKPVRNPPQSRIDGATKAVSGASVAELTARGRSIVLALMEELEFLNRHADELSEIVEAYFSGEKDDRIRFKLQKALDHETRTKSSTQLASALQKLQDAAPGKKEEQMIEAERVAAGGDDDWGDDLAAPVGKFN